MDFAGAHLDHRPDFPDEVWQEWEREKSEQFGVQWQSAAVEDEVSHHEGSVRVVRSEADLLSLADARNSGVEM